VSIVASGGTVGDLAKTGPDGCLYVTQSDHAEKLLLCFLPHPTAARPTTWGNFKSLYR